MTPGAAQRRLEFALVRQADRIRIILVFFLVVSTLVAYETFVSDGSLALGALALAALGSLWSYFFLRWDALLVRGVMPLAVAIITLFDVSWITLFVLGTDGWGSPFRGLLLLPVVFSASFFTGASLALPLTAFLVGALYVILAPLGGGFAPRLVWDIVAMELLVIAVAWFAWALASVLERERLANERIIRHLTEGVMLVSPPDTVAMVNPQMMEQLGLAPEQVVGLRLGTLVGRSGFALLALITEGVRRHPNQLVTQDLTLEGRRTVDLRVMTVPCGVSRGQAVAWVVIAQDITDVRAVARMKEQGLGVLSHELRTPLASLRVMAQLLSGMAGELSDAERTRVAGTIERETDRLSRLVASMLDVARVEDPTFELDLQPVALGDLAEGIADLYRMRAQGQNVRLVNEVAADLRPLPGDPDRLVQVLTNLVDNALKFTPPGGEVRLSAEDRGGEVRLAVSDTGPGIAEESLEHIFEKFAQARNPEAPAGAGGAGLGLYLARSLARKHGGDLTVTSRLGQGSTFTLILPRTDT